MNTEHETVIREMIDELEETISELRGNLETCEWDFKKKWIREQLIEPEARLAALEAVIDAQPRLYAVLTNWCGDAIEPGILSTHRTLRAANDAALAWVNSEVGKYDPDAEGHDDDNRDPDTEPCEYYASAARGHYQFSALVEEIPQTPNF